MNVKNSSVSNRTQYEIWKDITGLEGSYKVSSTGLMMHFYKNKRWKIVRPFTERTGYSVARLWLGDGTRKGVRVHRLVAKAFIPNPNNYEEINHKNGIKTDNRVENLEWCDRKYNAGYINVLNPDANQGENNPMAKYTNKQILEVYNLAWERELSYQQIADMFGMTKQEVPMIKFGKIWGHVTKHKLNKGNTINLKPCKRQFGNRNGEMCSQAKLTNEQVLEIYKLSHDPGTSAIKIGKRYSISPSNVYSIKNGYTWTHITKHEKKQ